MSGLRLLVIVNVYRPDLGGGILFSDLMEGMARNGVDVTVRCAYPYYPEWRDKWEANGLRVRKYTEDGVNVERYGIYIPRNPDSLIQRLIYEASFFFSLGRSLHRSRDFDVVMSYCPLVGGVAFGAAAAKLFGKPLWLNVQDLSASAAAAGGIVSEGFLSRLLERIQSGLFNRADVWSTLTPQMRKKLLEVARHDQPILLLPNWVHRSLNDAIANHSSMAPHRSSRSSTRLLYSGNLGSKQNLIVLCEHLHRGSANFLFEIRAAGSGLASLENWASHAGDDRFELGPLTDEDELARALHDADFYVITEKAGSGGSYVPSKLVPATIAGTPILAISDADSPLGQEVITHGLGPHFTWSNVDKAVSLVDNIADSAEAHDAWRDNLQRRSAHYDRAAVIAKYVDALRTLARGDVDRLAEIPSSDIAE